jgi:hypothetical protein
MRLLTAFCSFCLDLTVLLTQYNTNNRGGRGDFLRQSSLRSVGSSGGNASGCGTPTSTSGRGGTSGSIADDSYTKPDEGPVGANIFVYHLPHDLTDAVSCNNLLHNVTTTDVCLFVVGGYSIAVALLL